MAGKKIIDGSLQVNNLTDGTNTLTIANIAAKADLTITKVVKYATIYAYINSAMSNKETWYVGASNITACHMNATVMPCTGSTTNEYLVEVHFNIEGKTFGSDVDYRIYYSDVLSQLDMANYTVSHADAGATATLVVSPNSGTRGSWDSTATGNPYRNRLDSTTGTKNPYFSVGTDGHEIYGLGFVLRFVAVKNS